MRQRRVGDRVKVRCVGGVADGTVRRVGRGRYLVEYGVIDDLFCNPPERYVVAKWKFPWRIY
jgi:hypothetical protein